MTNVKGKLAAIRGLIPPVQAGGEINIVEQGGYIDINEITYKVISATRYLDVKWSNFKKRKNAYWVTELQLLGLLSGEKTFIEWEVDDELEVSQTLSQVNLRDVSYAGRPIKRADIVDISEEEEGEVKCNGKSFHYSEDDTWAALYYRSQSSEPLQVRMYEFEASDGEYLTIELWENEDSKPEREAFISKSLNPRSITVLQKSANNNEVIHT